MTAQQRTLASPGPHSGALGLALAAAFGVGLVSGLVAPRLLTPTHAVVKSVAAPAAQAQIGAAANQASGDRTRAGTPQTGPITVNPYTGFVVGPVSESPLVNPFTGFVVGPVSESPLVNPFTGFVVGRHVDQGGGR